MESHLSLKLGKPVLKRPILRLDSEDHLQPGVMSLKFSQLIMEA